MLILISGLALGWRQYELHTAPVPQIGGEYSEGVIGNPRTANPLLATSDADLDLAFLTHRGLFSTDAQGQIITDLAEKWILSEDQKTYLVTLRQGLLWSDGQPLTAADVVFTFESTKQAKLKSPLAASFRDVTVTALEDGLTIKFSLKEPYVPFIYALTLGLLPAHIWQNIPYENWLKSEANLRPVGSGPWRFNSLTRDSQGNILNYVLEPNPYNHANQPYLKRFVLRFFPDQASALSSLKQGSIDGLGDISRRERASLNPKRFAIYDLALPQYTAIFYNPNANEALKNIFIRQGLSYAINRPTLIQEALSGQAQPVTGPFIFGIIKTKASQGAITFDQTKTVQLFTKAGYTRNETDGLFMKDNQPLTITLTIVDNEEQLRVAEVIRHQWQAVGVAVQIQAVPAANFSSDVIMPRNYQALLASEVIGLDPDPYPFWHSSQVASPGLNLAMFQNHTADKLLVEARQISDPMARLEKYISFQNILRDESPATFLYSLTYSYAQNLAVKGFGRQTIAQPAERFWDSAFWYKRTVRGSSD